MTADISNFTPLVLFTDVRVGVGCVNCSFHSFAFVLKRALESKYSGFPVSITSTPLNSDLFLDDCFFATMKDVYNEKRVIWCDTPVSNPSVPLRYNEFKVVMVTSELVRKYASRYMRVDDVLPYFYLSDLAETYSKPFENRYGFSIVANTMYYDRKNLWPTLQALRDLAFVKYLRGICPLPECRAKPYTLREEEKYLLYGSTLFYLALSGIEGLGLTAIEAMGTGTPLIYLDAHVYRDYAVGIPVKPAGVQRVKVGMMEFEHYYFDVRELKEVLKYANGVKKEEWEDMSAKAKEAAVKRFSDTVVLPKLVAVLGSQ